MTPGPPRVLTMEQVPLALSSLLHAWTLMQCPPRPCHCQELCQNTGPDRAPSSRFTSPHPGEAIWATRSSYVCNRETYIRNNNPHSQTCIVTLPRPRHFDLGGFFIHTVNILKDIFKCDGVKMNVASVGPYLSFFLLIEKCHNILLVPQTAVPWAL